MEVIMTEKAYNKNAINSPLTKEELFAEAEKDRALERYKIDEEMKYKIRLAELETEIQLQQLKIEQMIIEKSFQESS